MQILIYVLTYLLDLQKTHISTYIFCGRHYFLWSADNGKTMEWMFELSLVQFYFDPSSLMISLRLFIDISFGRYKHEREVFKNITVLSWQCFFKYANFVDLGATYLLFSKSLTLIGWVWSLKTGDKTLFRFWRNSKERS